jgi:riboflavin kinase/FMN adenylyltransferase
MKFDTTLSENEPIAITIGNFDGIHRGHQNLMLQLRETAAELHCKPVLVTFSPHTLMVVRPDIDVQVLTTLEEKLALTQRYGGIDESLVISFTPEVMAISASDFLDSLRAHFHIRTLVVGENFSLGHNRAGNIAFLEEYGKQHDIVIRAIPLAADTQTRISSTRIRTLVSEGRVSAANELLGHPVTMSGVVVRGDQRGRLLGFPTANLIPPAHKLIPANGVYAVRVSIQERESTTGDSPINSHVYTGVANIGIRPTFNGKTRIVEAHLLDVNLDLYDKRITIDFIEHLRSEQRFPGIDALKAQIATDAQQARHILQMTGG